jgi:hypothetical protein
MDRIVVQLLISIKERRLKIQKGPVTSERGQYHCAVERAGLISTASRENFPGSQQRFVPRPFV